MKGAVVVISVIIVALSGFWFLGGAEKPKDAKSRKSIYDYSISLIDGTKKSLSEFKGKKILIVNVASRCGFTSQYEGLEKLYQANKDKLVIIGFPANDFMGQEPGTNEEIKAFCQLNYGVTFPLSQKISVVGNSKADLYHWLSEKELNGWNTKSPKWNFYKYLVSETGELLKVYPSSVDPMSKEILEAL
jgi:glutathione peroxidase